MKTYITIFIYALFFSVSNHHTKAQNMLLNKNASPVCDNEDFEVGTGGAITTSTSVSGWSIFKLVPPNSPLIDNCSLITSTAVTRAVPTSAYLFTANGYIDTLIGAAYPIYSVFGDGAPNGGNVTNPNLPTMFGTNFFRIGDASGTSYNHHSIEKTIAVTSANALFRYAFISVVKAGTSCCDAPSVQIKFFNTSQGNLLISCPSYSVNAPISSCSNSTIPLSASTNTSFSTIGTYYHKWKIQAVDLTPYIGSTIKFVMGVTYCSAGCNKYGYAYLDAQCSPMEIYVNEIPFPATTNSVTFSGCAVASATIVAPPDFSSYQWSGPAAFTSTLSTITTSTSGVYTLNIFASGTCSVITKYIAINLFPAASISVTTSNTLLCRGSSAKLSATGIITYSWNSQSGTSFINISPTVTSTYSVSGYNQNGCFASAIITQSVISCTGLIDFSDDEFGISIYPNPNNGEFNVLSKTNLNKGVIQLTNVLGQVVCSQEIKPGNNFIKTKNLNRGVYYFSVYAENKIVKKGRIEIE